MGSSDWPTVFGHIAGGVHVTGRPKAEYDQCAELGTDRPKVSSKGIIREAASKGRRDSSGIVPATWRGVGGREGPAGPRAHVPEHPGEVQRGVLDRVPEGQERSGFTGSCCMSVG